MGEDWRDTSPKERALLDTWVVIHRYRGKRRAVINHVRMAAFIAEHERFTVAELAECLGVTSATALYMLTGGSRLLPLRQDNGYWVNIEKELQRARQ